jgi:hypothetical protein
MVNLYKLKRNNRVIEQIGDEELYRIGYGKSNEQRGSL